MKLDFLTHCMLNDNLEFICVENRCVVFNTSSNFPIKSQMYIWDNEINIKLHYRSSSDDRQLPSVHSFDQIPFTKCYKFERTDNHLKVYLWEWSTASVDAKYSEVSRASLDEVAGLVFDSYKQFLGLK